MQKIIHKQLLGPLKGGISILRKILVIFLFNFQVNCKMILQLFLKFDIQHGDETERVLLQCMHGYFLNSTGDIQIYEQQ